MSVRSHLGLAIILIGPAAAFAGDDHRTPAVPADLATGSGELDTSRSELRETIGRYTSDHRALTRSIPVAAAPGGRDRLAKFTRGWLDALDRVDFDAMGQDGRIDAILLRNELDHEGRTLELRRRRDAEIEPLVPFARPIVELEEARRRMEPVDAQAVAGRLTELAKRVDQARKDAEAAQAPGKDKGPVSKSLALRAAAATDDLRATLGRWEGFYRGYDPLFTWWAAEPCKEVDQALKRHAATLREKLAGIKEGGDAREGREVVGDPVGRDGLLAELAYEMIPYSPEDLIVIAEKELAWSEEEMRQASRSMGLGDDWKAALERVKTKFVEPGKQPALIRELAQEAIDYLDARQLVTIPPLAREVWRMEMMSPERQLVTPFFTGGEVISVSFPTDGMTHEQKLMTLRGNNVHFTRAVVHHELIPGHHLQGFMSQRHRAYRSAFRTPFSVEGWALYWELRLWDLGFARSPEDRVGMLFWRMHRCARIIFSLKFHLGEMTPDQCVAFLVDRVGHERANATGEVRRSFDGSYGPLYQAAYLLGGMQLHALQKELVGPGRMTERAFHDAVLKENAIPAALVRASLAGIELDRAGYTAAWEFHGPSPIRK